MYEYLTCLPVNSKSSAAEGCHTIYLFLSFKATQKEEWEKERKEEVCKVKDANNSGWHQH